MRAWISTGRSACPRDLKRIAVRSFVSVYRIMSPRSLPLKKAADPFPDTLAPQLATLVSKPPDRGDWVYEIKLDGYRILARCEGGKVRLFTRNSNDWTAKMASLAREVAALPVESAWLDGEVVVLGEDGIPVFNTLQNAFDKRGTEVSVR